MPALPSIPSSQQQPSVPPIGVPSSSEFHPQTFSAPPPPEKIGIRTVLDYGFWVVLFLLAPFTVLILLSQNTLPGDLFYPVKRGMENVALVAVSVNPRTKAFFHADLADRRFGEAESLLLKQADAQGLTDFIDEVQTTQQSIDTLSESAQKDQLTQQLITKIDEYQAKLVQTQAQVQNNPTFIARVAAEQSTQPQSLQPTNVPTQNSQTQSSQNQVSSGVTPTITQSVPTATVANPTQPGTTTEPKMCIQVITFAKNPTGGTCQAFSTPCDVPTGWTHCSPDQTSPSQPVPSIPTTRVISPTTSQPVVLPTRAVGSTVPVTKPSDVNGAIKKTQEELKRIQEEVEKRKKENAAKQNTTHQQSIKEKEIPLSPTVQIILPTRVQNIPTVVPSVPSTIRSGKEEKR